MTSKENFDLPRGDHSLRIQRIAVDADSTEPTLVFLHDSLGSIALWRDFPVKLVARVALNAIVFDRRGYGESSHFAAAHRTRRYLEAEAEALTETLTALDISSAVLFGHSDGGSIALIAAALNNMPIRAVVTEGAHVFVEDITLAGIREAKEILRTTNLREKLVRYHGDRTDAVTSAWIDTWLSPEFRDWNIEAYLPSIVCPVLVIQGMADEYGSKAQVRAIVDTVSGPSESLMIPNVGHTPHRDAAAVVVDTTADFLMKHLRRSASAAEL